MTAVGGLPRHEPQALRSAAEDVVLDGENGNRVGARIHRQPDPDAPCAVLVHGLVGSNDSPYVVGTAAKAYARGFHVVRLIARNCGGTEELARDSYHGGMTGDLETVARGLVEERGMKRVYLIGYSLGGNMVLKLAAELGARAPEWLAGVATLSPCLDFGAAADAMDKTAFGRLCQRRFLVGLRRIIQKRRELHDPSIELEGLRALRTIREFDDRYTAPMGGFDGVEHYYREASAWSLIPEVRTRALMIAARDDPLVPFESFERPAVTGNPDVRLVATDHGGHVAFLGSEPARSGDRVDPDRHWAESRLVDFCAALEHEGGFRPRPW